MIVSIAILFAHEFLVLSTVTNLSERRYAGATHMLCLVGGTALLVVWEPLLDDLPVSPYLLPALYMGYVIGATRWTARARLLLRAAACMLTYLIAHITYTLLLLCAAILKNPALGYSAFAPFSEGGPTRQLFLGVYIGVEVLIYLCLRKHFDKMRVLSNWHCLVLLLTCTALYIAIYAPSSALLQVAFTPAIQTAIAICLLCVIFCALLVVGILILVSHFQEKKKENRLLEATNRLMTDNYRKMHTNQQAFAKQVHDFNHHLTALRGLAAKEKTGEVCAYIDSLLRTTYQEIALCHSGNDVIDAIINCKAEEAKAAHIAFHYHALFAQPACVDPVDICAILSNQIANALEACSQIADEKQRLVEVHIWQQTENMAFFKVVNTAAFHPPANGKKFFSTKRDSSGPHGLGMRIIQETARKYQGELHCQYTKGRFMSTAFLCYQTAGEPAAQSKPPLRLDEAQIAAPPGA